MAGKQNKIAAKGVILQKRFHKKLETVLSMKLVKSV